jgi:transposase
MGTLFNLTLADERGKIMSDIKSKTTRWAGIDVSKATFDVRLHPVLPPEKEKPSLADLPKAQFPRTEDGTRRLLAWLDKAGGTDGTRVVMEATGRYSIELGEMIIQMRPDLAPAIVNPRSVLHFAKSLNLRNKNDTLDAALLARYGAERFPAPWIRKSPEFCKLQELVRQRAYLVSSQTAAKNRLTELVEFPEIAKLQKSVVSKMEKAIEAAEKMISQLIASNKWMSKSMELLLSIPGVGFITAFTVLGEIGDLTQFKTSRRLSSFAGLSPVQKKSGTSVNGETRMSKMGPPEVRRVLYLAAMAAYRGNSDLAKFGKDLVGRGKTKMQAIGAIMRKILILMRAVLISGQKYQDGFSKEKANSAA